MVAITKTYKLKLNLINATLEFAEKLKGKNSLKVRLFLEKIKLGIIKKQSKVLFSQIINK